jgi:AcrR family transcriptional regulator
MVQGRPGVARSQGARLAVLHATATLLERVGYGDLTIAGIASEAGVGKQTIYRWYPSKDAVIADCLAEGLLLTDDFPLPDTGDVAEDVTSWLVQLFAYIDRDDHVKLLESLLSSAIGNVEIAQRLGERLGSIGPTIIARLEAAQDAGEFSSKRSATLVSEAIFGLIVVRAMGGLPFHEEDARAIAAFALGR